MDEASTPEQGSTALETAPTVTSAGASAEEPTASPATPPESAAELDRLTAELSKKSAEYDTLKQQHDTLIRRISLDGKVTDVNLALKVLDPGRHLNKDGTVDLFGLFQEFPSLAPIRSATSPDGGGSTQSSVPTNDLDTAAATGNRFTINAAFDALLKGDRR